jgi:hypothetical protein
MKVEGWDMGFVMSRAEKFSRGFIVSDRNFDIKFGWAALE